MLSLMVHVDTDFFDRPIACETQTYNKFQVVSIGQTDDGLVITFMKDLETREYAVIEAGSVFYGGLTENAGE